MSYKSPIEITYGDLKTRIEDNAYSVVQSYGINVDKAELLKALEYDREQYRQGYADGQKEERTAKVAHKWTMMLNPFDESTSPTEAGCYRIIDMYGTEMTDYYFAEPRMTPRGVAYWKDCENPIVAWMKEDTNGTD